MNKVDNFHSQLEIITGFTEWKELEDLQNTGAHKDKINKKVKDVINKLKEVEGFQTPSEFSKEQLADSLISWLITNLVHINENDKNLLKNVSKIFKKHFNIDEKTSKIKDIRKILNQDFNDIKNEINEKTELEIIGLIEGDLLNEYQKSLIFLDLLKDNKDMFRKTLHRVRYQASEIIFDTLITTMINVIDKRKIPKLAMTLFKIDISTIDNNIDLLVDCCDKKMIPKLANIVIKEDSFSFEMNVDKFVACCDKKEIPKLVEIVLEEQPIAFALYVDKYIACCDKGEIPKLAEIVLEKNDIVFARNVDKFIAAGLDEREIPRMAKILLKNAPYAFAENVDKFVASGLNKDKIPKFAEIVLENAPYAFASNVDKFVASGLKKEKILKMAKRVIEKDPKAFLNNVDKFVASGLNKKEIPELAKLVLEKDYFALSTFIDQFIPFCNHKDIPKLSEIVAERYFMPFAMELNRFIAACDKEDLSKLAEIVAKKDSKTFSRNVNKFELNLDEMKKIIIHCVNSHYPGLDISSLLKLMDSQKQTESQKFTLTYFITALDMFKENQISIENIKMIQDLNGKKEELKNTIIGKKKTFNKSLQNRYNKALQNALNKGQFNNILVEIAKYRNPDMRNVFTDGIIKVLNNNPKFYKSLTKKKNKHIILPNIFLSQLQMQGVDKRVCEGYRDEMNKMSYLKDYKYNHPHNDLLKKIVDSKLDLSDKENLLNIIKQTKDKNELLVNLHALIGIFGLNQDALKKENLDKNHNDPSRILEDEFKKALPLGEIENIAKKHLDKFTKLRKNHLLFVYTGKLKSLPENTELLESMATCIRGILEGTFKSDRYDLNKSEHLKILFENNKDLLDEWRKGSKMDLKSILDKIRSKKITQTDFTTIFKQEFQDGHLDENEYHYLSGYINGNTQELQDLLKDSFEDDPKLHIQKLGIELTNPELKASEQIQLLKEMKSLIEKLADKPTDFLHQINGLIKNLSKGKTDYTGWKIIDTDEPDDLFLSGTEIDGSCQRITGEPYLNKCLLGYVRDGKNRMLAIKNKDGEIKARMIMRMLLDEENKPVLFIERVYTSVLDTHLSEALIKFAKKRAKALNLTILSNEVGTGKEYKGTIRSEGSPVPYEYSDAGDRDYGAGVFPNGKYTISNSLEISNF